MTTTTGNVSNGTGFGWGNYPKRKRNEEVSESDDLFSTKTGDLQEPVNKETIQPADDKEGNDEDDREKPAQPQDTTIKGSKVLIVNSRQRFLEGLENFLKQHLDEETTSGVGPSAVATAGSQMASSSSAAANPNASNAPQSLVPDKKPDQENPKLDLSKVQAALDDAKKVEKEKERLGDRDRTAQENILKLIGSLVSGQGKTT